MTAGADARAALARHVCRTPQEAAAAEELLERALELAEAERLTVLEAWRRLTAAPTPPARLSVAELEQRARQADRDRDEAGRTYRGLVYAADQAWRPLGGRP